VDPFAIEIGPIKVVGVYCDVSAYITSTQQLLAIASRSGCSCQSTWWNLASLNDPETCHAAARAATEADVIWCAACACQPLPHAVRGWMQEWAAQQHKADATLVALLRCPLEGDVGTSPTRLCLCAAAREAGLEFCEQRVICNCGDCETDYGRWESHQPELPRPIPFSVEDRPTCGWGINE